MDDKKVTHPTESPDQDKPMNLSALADFFFEVGMLKKTPRSGFQFLGTGRESVADHSFRVAVIGFCLARLVDHPDPFRVVCLCLFHDLPEARTGDMNYVNKQYVQVDERKATAHLAAALPFGDELEALLDEYRSRQTEASRLAHDADQLDLILELKQQKDLGNTYAQEWMRYALERLHTDMGRKLAEQILKTDWTAWWFDGNDHWWV
ncbi:HD domain-containing protein [Desulfacinum hydrothermale]|nr:HD domain-containing protein [Desulfacinum hydrothermale]